MKLLKAPRWLTDSIERVGNERAQELAPAMAQELAKELFEQYKAAHLADQATMTRALEAIATQQDQTNRLLEYILARDGNGHTPHDNDPSQGD